MGQSHNQQSIPLCLIRQIAERIDSGERLTNRELLALCSEGGVDDPLTDPHLCHEIAETALNFLIATKYGRPLLSSREPNVACKEILRPLHQQLPTQSWRSPAQITFQQFSTPAPIAYLATYLLDVGENDTVLEPSSGTGCLAVWASGAGATVFTNEIDAGRRELSNLIGLNPTDFDAEFIDDLLPENLAPNLALTNPPFTSSGGRVERNKKEFGFRHVESALRRLSRGGRFAVIFGESGSPQSASGRCFWDLLLPEIQVTGSIALPGREYYRNGTTVGVTLIVGYKRKFDEPRLSMPDNDSIHLDAASVEDAFHQAIDTGLRLTLDPNHQTT